MVGVPYSNSVHGVKHILVHAGSAYSVLTGTYLPTTQQAGRLAHQLDHARFESPCGDNTPRTATRADSIRLASFRLSFCALLARLRPWHPITKPPLFLETRSPLHTKKQSVLATQPSLRSCNIGLLALSPCHEATQKLGRLDVSCFMCFVTVVTCESSGKRAGKLRANFASRKDVVGLCRHTTPVSRLVSKKEGPG